MTLVTAPTAPATAADPPDIPRLRRPSPARLHHLAGRLAARTDQWRPHVRFAHESRWSVRVAVTADYEAWLLSWLPGQSTGLHDHGGSAGAFTVLEGIVEESTLAPSCSRGPAALVHRTLGSGRVRAFGADYVHDVTNARAPCGQPARLRPCAGHHAQVRPRRRGAPAGRLPRALRDRLVSAASPQSIVDLLATARAGLLRLDPPSAVAARADGAVLVDIRPAAQRADEGDVPGAMLVERNVLEWRFDPASEARLPIACYDLHVIVLCSEGYTSSLAAYALQQVGVRRATDVIGGLQAWRAAGLPTSGGSPARPALSLVPQPARPTTTTGPPATACPTSWSTRMPGGPSSGATSSS